MGTTIEQQMAAIKLSLNVAESGLRQRGTFDYSDNLTWRALNDAYSSLADLRINNIKRIQKRKSKGESLAYGMCIEFWLKEFHTGWIFKGQHGKCMKSIIEKIRQSCKHASMEGNDIQIFLSFKKMCLNLPAWYKDKDLAVLDSKYNEIVNEIRNEKPKDGFNGKNSHERFSDFAGRV